MAHRQKHLDAGSLLVIFITLTLFVAALFFKGLTHVLLLEGGVFLVSVKLILMSYKNGVASDRLFERLDEMHCTLPRLEESTVPNQRLQRTALASGGSQEQIVFGPVP